MGIKLQPASPIFSESVAAHVLAGDARTAMLLPPSPAAAIGRRASVAPPSARGERALLGAPKRTVKPEGGGGRPRETRGGGQRLLVR